MSIIENIASQMIQVNADRIILKNEATNFRWTVKLEPFRLGAFAVTEEQYLQITKGETRDSQKPVVNVSWLDATEFCNNLSKQADLTPCYSSDKNGQMLCDWLANGYRLPSEAEWEFACRAGTRADRYGEIDEIAWYKKNSDAQVQPVGAKTPNAFGFYDMLGNVWEWCWDIFDPEEYGSYRVFRGGGWFDPPHSCRASARRKSHPSFLIDDLGFRLAQSI